MLLPVERASNPDYDIESAGFMLALPEHFPHDASHIVSCHCPAGDPPRHHDGEAGKTERIGLDQNRQVEA